MGSHYMDFHEILYLSISLKSVENFKFRHNLTRITGTLHDEHYTLIIISHSILLRMRNFSDKICRDNQNTYFTFNNFFFSKIVPFMK